MQGHGCRRHRQNLADADVRRCRWQRQDHAAPTHPQDGHGGSKPWPRRGRVGNRIFSTPCPKHRHGRRTLEPPSQRTHISNGMAIAFKSHIHLRHTPVLCPL